MKQLDAISLDEILAELGANATQSTEYVTTKGLAKQWGIAKSRVDKLLDMLQEAGRLSAKEVQITNRAGRTQFVPGYRILPARKGKK